MIRILAALEALCRACPDVTGIAVDVFPDGKPHFTIKCATDEAVHRLAAEQGMTVRSHVGTTTSWLASYGRMTIYGPHHDLVPATPKDDGAINAALALADEAVRP